MTLLIVGVVFYLVWSGKAGNVLRSLATKADHATEKLTELKNQHGSPLK